MTLLAMACAVVAACCFAGSVALQHGAVNAQKTTHLSLKTLWRAIRSPRWLAGTALIRAASLDIFTNNQLMTGLGWAVESVTLILAGGWAVHHAYATGPAATVIAVTTVVDPLTAVVIGLWCYGEAAHLTAFAFFA